MSLTCSAVAFRLPSGGELPDLLARHAATCLRCQAEQARYRSLRRVLGELPRDAHRAPAGLVESVVDRLGEPAGRRSSPALVRMAVAAAAGAAVVAAGTAVVVGWRRVRAA